ncbi:MAG: glutamate--tRNA ligase [Candidatus Zixiibacteriota bacterium]|nr:MAG: glutamate--tRNA ligase [candidate division Zixibacteria bacterium]
MNRVRFAPSPTGDLHVGGLRTALYNVLFARKTGGAFILRLEDTDRERNLPEAHKDILNLLRRCGLEPDEGPDTGGPFAPYVQSERLALYAEHAAKLLEAGHAYPCFCSAERLEELRQQQRAAGQTPGYDRRCRSIDPAEARQRMASEPHVLRLAIPLEGEIVHQDRVWGALTFPLADVDDQVLVKSDGYPTYHLANVVDDHLMEITHVIRGEEWLPSVPKHLLLYRFFGWEAPEFAHLPLILNEQHRKLSKREGTGSVLAWLDRGIPPEALINYVALLGWHPSDEREFFTFAELVEAFDLERVSRAGAVFDPAKLEWLASEHLKLVPTPELLAQARPYLKSTEFARASDDLLLPLVEAVRAGLRRLDELPARLAPFSLRLTEPDEEAWSWIRADAARRSLPVILRRWHDGNYTEAEAMLEAVRQVGKETGIKGKELWMPLRASLTGRTGGPELKAILAHIGPDEAVARLARMLDIKP